LWATIGTTILLIDLLVVRVLLFVIAAIITLHVGTTASRRAGRVRASDMATTPGSS
jgi:hypothetical protein